MMRFCNVFDRNEAVLPGGELDFEGEEDRGGDAIQNTDVYQSEGSFGEWPGEQDPLPVGQRHGALLGAQLDHFRCHLGPDLC